MRELVAVAAAALLLTGVAFGAAFAFTGGVDVGFDGDDADYGGDVGGVFDAVDDVEREGDGDGVEASDAGDSPEDTYFSDVASAVGFEFSASEEFDKLEEGEVVAGVYVSDVDRDGWPDLLALDGTEPVLFENHEGEFERSDILPEVDVSVDAALFLDHDNSGYDDLLLLSEERSVFLVNTGGGFVEREVGFEVGFEGVRGASAADYTGDGCLDVFVVSAGDWLEQRPAAYNHDSVSIDDDNGEPNRLFRGDCGSFEETTEEAGVRGYGWSLATSFVDLTGDGLADVHVANDFNNDVLYLNRGDGSFERRMMPEFTDRNGMSSEVADVTGNGLLDIFVTNIYAPPEYEGLDYRFGGRTLGNNLLLNEGDGEFRDAAEEHGVVDGGWGWAAVLEDFTNSGYLDLMHAVTGDGVLTEQPLWIRGDSAFERVDPELTGLDTDGALGAAALDFDRDGGVDVALGEPASTFGLYSNGIADGNWLQVDVRPRQEGTSYGTRVTVRTTEGVETGYVTSGSDYMSQSSRVVHLGLGNASVVTELVVEYPDGDRVAVSDVEANQRFTVGPEGVEEA